MNQYWICNECEMQSFGGIVIDLLLFQKTWNYIYLLNIWNKHSKFIWFYFSIFTDTLDNAFQQTKKKVLVKSFLFRKCDNSTLHIMKEFGMIYSPFKGFGIILWYVFRLLSIAHQTFLVTVCKILLLRRSLNALIY